MGTSDIFECRIYEVCPCPEGIAHRHCNMDENGNNINCVRYPLDFNLINHAPVESGQDGTVSWYVVDVPLLLKTLDEGVSDEESSFESGALQTPNGEWNNSGDLSNLDYVEAMHALAPRGAELLLLKADYLYRSLSDRDLQSKDAGYVANEEINPNGENRILKAQYFYDSVMYLAVDAIESTSPGGAGFADEISSENPFKAEILLAYWQKQKLMEGRNYFGFFPDFYFYAKPSEVRPYLDAIKNLSDDSREIYQTARNNVAAVVVGQNAAVIEMNLNYGYEIDIYESELVLIEEKLRALASRIDMTLQRIDENAREIEATGGVAVGVSSCEPCVRDQQGNCLPPTIQSEIALLEECAQQKPCDWLCWTKRVFDIVKKIYTIVKLVIDLYMENWAGAFATLDSALTAVQQEARESETFVDGLKAVGKYADVLSGKEAEPFRKGAEKIGGIKENFDGITSGIDSLQSINSSAIAQEIAGIVINSDATAQGLQTSLTEIYHVQAQLEDNPSGIVSPEWAWAHARSIEDLTKYNQDLNREIPDLQRQHVLAAQDYALAMTEWEVLNQKIELANNVREFLGRIVERYDEAIVQAQANLDRTVRNASLIQERLLLLGYFYTRSKDFMYLNPPTDFDFTTNLLLPEDLENYQLDSANNILIEFLDFARTKEDGYVFDTIVPAGFKVQYTDDLGETSPTITTRTQQEMAEAICPEYDPVSSTLGTDCTLTKVAYDDRMINQLKESGIAAFEIFPASLPSFRDLSDEEKREWNRSFSLADLSYTSDGFENQPSYKKRIMDVSARFLLENYTYPSPSIGPKIRISHGPAARFLMSSNEYETFIFPPTAMKDACVAVNSLIGNERFSCDDFTYFYKEVQWLPFDLGALDVSEFQTYHMFGTSLRGTWTIDIREFLSQLSYTEREEFWEAFRGIEYRVYFVSIP